MSTRRVLSSTVLLLASAVCLVGCRHAPASRNLSLIVLPGASQVKYVNQGTEQITYEVREEYPAEKALKTISGQLAKQGWTPLKEDYLNPGLPSSHVRGWTNFGDANRQDVRQWLAQWRNAAGDVVEYVLRYRSPFGSQVRSDRLQVVAIYMSAKVAKAAKASVRKP